MLKANSDCFKIKETPVAAASVWTKTPEFNPNAISIPFFAPFAMLSVRTKILSGPGIKAMRKDAKQNDKKTDISTMQIKQESQGSCYFLDSLIRNRLVIST